MTEELVVIGAAGVGRRCLDIVQSMNAAGRSDYKILGVYDDHPQEADLAKLAKRNIPYLGSINCLLKAPENLNVVLGVGYPGTRAKILHRLRDRSWHFPTIIDPHANFGSNVTHGDGVVVSAGCLLGTHVDLGDFSHLTPGVNIGHDTEVGCNVTISSGAILAGGVSIGRSVLVGAGAIVLQQLVVGEHSVIGAGAVVTKPVPMNTMVKGVPAK